jgi:hypothetical protein
MPFVRMLPLIAALFSAVSGVAQNLPEPGWKISTTATTVLLAHDAERSPSLKEFQPNPTKPFARFYIGEWRTQDQFFDWKIEVMEQGEYEVSIVSEGASAVSVGVDGARVEATVMDRAWNRTPLGNLRLAEGTHHLRAVLREDLAQEGKLRAIELTPLVAKADIARRVQALRSDTSWLRDRKYGVMFQWGEWGFPRTGPAKPWPQMIDDFDVEEFARMIDEEMGAGYVVWSLTWRSARFAAPLKSVETLVPGHTAKRDLIAELAASLERRGMKLLLYYHPGHEDPAWWKANWTSLEDTKPFVDQWCSVISEIGNRYQEKLAGWFFDDGIVYPPAEFERMTMAAKSGFSGRLVSYNSWILGAISAQARSPEFSPSSEADRRTSSIKLLAKPRDKQKSGEC